MSEEKTLGNTDVNGTKKNVPDVVVFGDGDMFKLLCKASSQSQGWMKSTKAMEIPGIGCVVQVTTQQKNPDGSYSVAEALTFVPGVYIESELAHPFDSTDGKIPPVIGRSLVSSSSNNSQPPQDPEEVRRLHTQLALCVLRENGVITEIEMERLQGLPTQEAAGEIDSPL